MSEKDYCKFSMSPSMKRIMEKRYGKFFDGNFDSNPNSWSSIMMYPYPKLPIPDGAKFDPTMIDTKKVERKDEKS